MCLVACTELGFLPHQTYVIPLRRRSEGPWDTDAILPASHQAIAWLEAVSLTDAPPRSGNRSKRKFLIHPQRL